MSKDNSKKEIEEAQKKARGDFKSDEKRVVEQKKKEPEKLEKVLEKKTAEAEKGEAELAERAEEEQPQSEQEQKSGTGADLEEITKGVQPIPAEIRDSPYVEQLSQRPMAEIYKEIKDIYKTVEGKGYLSTLEQKHVLYLESAVEKKIQDEERGIYSFSEEAARAASVTQQLSATLMGSYKGKKANDMYQHQEKWKI